MDDEQEILLETIRQELRSIERQVKRVRTLAAQMAKPDTSPEADTQEGHREQQERGEGTTQAAA